MFIQQNFNKTCECVCSRPFLELMLRSSVQNNQRIEGANASKWMADLLLEAIVLLSSVPQCKTTNVLKDRMPDMLLKSLFLSTMQNNQCMERANNQQINGRPIYGASASFLRKHYYFNSFRFDTLSFSILSFWQNYFLCAVN